MSKEVLVSISEMSIDGNITFTFNQKLVVPELMKNDTLRKLREDRELTIDWNNIIEVIIYSYDDETGSYYEGQTQFSQNITSWTESGLTMHLEIENPLLVS